MRRITLASCCFTLALGCTAPVEDPPADAGTSDAGPVDAGSVDAGTEATPADLAAAELARARCDYFKRCLPQVELVECTGKTGLSFDLAKEVAAGRQALDTAGAEACVAAVDALACTGETFQLIELTIARCVVGHGRVEVDGACFGDAACVEGTYCDLSACPGRCAARAAAGESCATARCAADLYCKASTKKCTATKADGATCGDSAECTGGYCGYSTAGNTCRPPGLAKPEGAACANDPCADGLYCRSTGSGPARCAQVVAQGAACGTYEDPSGIDSACGVTRTCRGGAVTFTETDMVVTAGTCEAWSRLGDPCVRIPAEANNGVTGCLSGLACGTDGKCALPPSSGPCGQGIYAECATGFFCDTARTCQPLRALGESCGMWSDCTSASCLEGKCAAPSPSCSAP